MSARRASGRRPSTVMPPLSFIALTNAAGEELLLRRDHVESLRKVAGDRIEVVMRSGTFHDIPADTPAETLAEML